MNKQIAGCSKNIDTSHIPAVQTDRLNLGKRKMWNRNILDFCQQKSSPETSLHKKVKSGGVSVLIDDMIMSDSSIDDDIELSV